MKQYLVKRSLLLLTSFFILRTSISQTPYWQQQVNYVIDVTLNDVEHTLDGFEKIEYINNSPDTLHFIWFHLWPNAFKNDQTAFSDQQLENGSTDFYFSDKDQRGYINRLDFRINNEVIKTEDHPQHIDIIKLILAKPLAPGSSINISTPFHVKLPYNFSRGGHVDQSYQVTQWYPKPAVYDKKGWHPMPYLEQGEFYSEFGNYDVRITLPKNYVVPATGELQNKEEKEWLRERRPEAGSQKSEVRSQKSEVRSKTSKMDASKTQNFPPSSSETKTLNYLQSNVHDFAWFADKRFVVLSDTIQLNNRIINAFAFYFIEEQKTGESESWEKSIQFIRDAIRFRSGSVGEYPFNVVSVVEAKMGFEGGMEYPTITSISPMNDETQLEETIEHEIGHNWFQGILATNERAFPWMDEGINTYYDLRYHKEKFPAPVNNKTKKGLSETDFIKRTLDTWINWKKDQPVATSSDSFSMINYGLIAYFKTAFWLQEMEAYAGKEKFDEGMKAYYETWKFRHPYPEDFRKIMEERTGKDLSEFFYAITVKETRPVFEKNRNIRLTPFFSPGDYKKNNYIGLFPALGFNRYDKFMIGAGIHNYNLPSGKFQFVLAPLYATNSKQLNGIGRLGYSWYPAHNFYKAEVSVSGERFSKNASLDSNYKKVFEYFYKITPALRLYFNESARSKRERFIEFRTYFIGEKDFKKLVQKSTDGLYYVDSSSTTNRYLNQLTFAGSNFRVLYPYEYQLQFQQGEGFYRINLNAEQFFNYAKGGRMGVRLFAAKFGFLGNREKNEFLVYRYQPKLLAIRGEEDYTYSNYFAGRTASSAFTDDVPVSNKGFAMQQIMIRDGAMKLRLDQYPFLHGRSDNWVAALNFNSTLPNKLFPVKLPVKIFFDLGTYAEAWKKESGTSRFLYVGGLQLSLLKDIINVYAPVLYSKEFRDQLKTNPEENKFFKRISFSIDIQKINLRKYIQQAQLL